MEGTMQFLRVNMTTQTVQWKDVPKEYSTLGGRALTSIMMSARSGQAFTGDDWTKLGERVIRAELEFNRKAGFTNKDDRLPPMFYNEPLPPYNVVVKVSDEEMDSTFADYK
jgi:aldehyde:ferredoxin oxidoreductase